MKKAFLIVLLFVFSTTITMATVNMPEGPVSVTSSSTASPSSSYKTNSYQNPYSKTTPQNTGTKMNTDTGRNTTLDSLAMSVLRAAEKRNNAEMNSYIQKMQQAGAEGVSSPQIIAKQTPHCPPIKVQVNGKKLSGSLCGVFSYLYKGKQYEVGYCK